MPIFRLILILGIAAGLSLFALQNWSPGLALTFLGLQTPALPLAVWIVGAIAAGMLSTLLIAALTGLVGYGSRRQLRRPRPQDQGFGRYEAAVSGRSTSQTASSGRQTANYANTSARSTNSRSTPSSDWEEDASDWFEEDQDWGDRSSRGATPPSSGNSNRTTSSQSGSSYSSGNRNPGSSGVGRSEVVDADYRVIVPPYNPSQSGQDD